MLVACWVSCGGQFGCVFWCKILVCYISELSFAFQIVQMRKMMKMMKMKKKTLLYRRKEKRTRSQ